MRKEIKAAIIVSAILFIGTATAIEDITINPDQDPIVAIVGTPLSTFPPANVTYTDWTTSGGSSYQINVTHDASGTINCTFSGNITSDPQTVELAGCVLGNKDNHTIEAQGYCQKGSCVNPKRSRLTVVEAPISPIPELATRVLVGAGMIGLIGIRRRYKK